MKLRGLGDIRTRTGISGDLTPRTARSAYLELAALEMVKARLGREVEGLETRKASVRERLRDVDKKVTELRHFCDRADAAASRIFAWPERTPRRAESAPPSEVPAIREKRFSYGPSRAEGNAAGTGSGATDAGRPAEGRSRESHSQEGHCGSEFASAT